MFLKKISILSAIMVIAIMANVSSAQWLWWTNDAANNQWTDTGNWTAFPTGGDDVVIGRDTANGPILNTGETGYAAWMHLSDTTASGSLLTINGGTLQVGDHLLVGENWGAGHKGTLLVNSGTVNTTLLMVGGGTSGSIGDGSVIINGGTINVSWLLAVAGGYSGTNSGGTGNIQLAGGVIDVTGGGGLVMADNGSIDITGGALILNGEISDITNYGNVTAFGGNGSFVYDIAGGRTTITAMIPEPATLIIIGLGSLLLRRKTR
ncbi:MAG: hypothetical protein A2Y10_17240 [Planctomycetes bacterium GWF2_41_51]|nr:MAG: hypothetical protein A2Y10_17240 [Planctomycetes bacterium GWF2_41_51]HBG27878.1 hypothetical protein [Phycisphaerales bacterium]